LVRSLSCMSATEPRYCPISTLHRKLRQGTESKGRARATLTRRLPARRHHIPPQGSSCVAHAVILASCAATPGAAACRRSDRQPQGQPLRQARAVQAQEPAAAICRGRAAGGYWARRRLSPAVREPVNATDIGELSPPDPQRRDDRDLPARCRGCERPTRLESHAPFVRGREKVLYPTSLPPAYPIRLTRIRL
jgi:hypothetical protein